MKELLGSWKDLNLFCLINLLDGVTKTSHTPLFLCPWVWLCPCSLNLRDACTRKHIILLSFPFLQSFPLCYLCYLFLHFCLPHFFVFRQMVRPALGRGLRVAGIFLMLWDIHEAEHPWDFPSCSVKWEPCEDLSPRSHLHLTCIFAPRKPAKPTAHFRFQMLHDGWRWSRTFILIRCLPQMHEHFYWGLLCWKQTPFCLSLSVQPLQPR